MAHMRVYRCDVYYLTMRRNKERHIVVCDANVFWLDPLCDAHQTRAYSQYKEDGGDNNNNKNETGVSM